MKYTFLTDEEIADLPKAPNEAWARVVGQVSRYVDSRISRNTSIENDDLLRRHAIKFIESVAKKLSINLSDIGNKPVPKEKLAALEVKAAAITYDSLADKISKTIEAPFSETGGHISLSGSGLVRLFQLSRQLREEVLAMPFDAAQQKKLLLLLDEFDEAIQTKRVSVARIMTIVAIVAAGVAGVTSTLADAPSAIETIGKITSAIGMEVESEEEVKRITAEKEQLRLPAPTNGQESKP